MTETEVVQILRKHMEGLFPMTCTRCKHSFATLREFMLITHRLEPVMSYDAEMGNWSPPHPFGTIAMANCPCGTTLLVSTRGLSLSKQWQFLEWVKIEMERRRLSQAELLGYLRDEIRKQVLAEPGQ